MEVFCTNRLFNPSVFPVVASDDRSIFQYNYHAFVNALHGFIGSFMMLSVASCIFLSLALYSWMMPSAWDSLTSVM